MLKARVVAVVSYPAAIMMLVWLAICLCMYALMLLRLPVSLLIVRHMHATCMLCTKSATEQQQQCDYCRTVLRDNRIYCMAE